MTGIESENFYNADERKYILEENQEFLELYHSVFSSQYRPILDINQIQKLINDIVNFYEFKYPNNFFRLFQYSHDGKSIEITRKIADMLDFRQLKLRLYHDYVQFLECSYCDHIFLRRPKKNLWDLSMASVRVYPNGILDKHDLEILEEHRFIDDISDINHIEHLYGKFEAMDTDVDYSYVRNCVLNHKNNVTLRNRVLSLIPLAMIYSNNTNPDYGYVRAKSFIRTINKEYNLDLNLDELDIIMGVDYSEKNKVKRK